MIGLPRGSVHTIALALLCSVVNTSSVPAQQPSPPAPQPAPPAPPPSPPPPQPQPLPAAPVPPVGAITQYRAPLIALVQPLEGGVIPQDRPVVVFRFAAGEASDPIDARSLSISVDGEDRTGLFQMSAAEAWGPIAAAGAVMAPGPHQLEARICSGRGACSRARAVVVVAAHPAAQASHGNGGGDGKKQRVKEALLGVIRTLIK